MSKSLKPGTPAPKSGQYQNPKTGTEVTGVQGKPLPPTPPPVRGTFWLTRPSTSVSRATNLPALSRRRGEIHSRLPSPCA